MESWIWNNNTHDHFPEEGKSEVHTDATILSVYNHFIAIHIVTVSYAFRSCSFISAFLVSGTWWAPVSAFWVKEKNYPKWVLFYEIHCNSSWCELLPWENALMWGGEWREFNPQLFTFLNGVCILEGNCKNRHETFKKLKFVLNFVKSMSKIVSNKSSSS